MSRARTERLLNLVIALLATRRYLSREEIRRLVPGYAESGEAFERAFERDKEALREMGVPVETGSDDPWFEDEVGYRIRRDAYALPEVSFTRDEMAVLTLAAQAWRQAALADAASSALRKLAAYGVETDDLTVAGIDPRIDGNEAAFLPLWRAVRDGVPVRFDYHRSGADVPATRTLEPWGVLSWHGRWYVVGHDRDRAATRVFRLSRIAGDVVAVGAPGEVVVPTGVDLRAEVALLSGSAPRATARIRVRPGAGGWLRRVADASGSSGAGRDGWDVLEVPYADAGLLADDLVSLGADVVVEAPAELRDAVVRRLRAVLEPARSPAGSAAGTPR